MRPAQRPFRAAPAWTASSSSTSSSSFSPVSDPLEGRNKAREDTGLANPGIEVCYVNVVLQVLRACGVTSSSIPAPTCHAWTKPVDDVHDLPKIVPVSILEVLSPAWSRRRDAHCPHCKVTLAFKLALHPRLARTSEVERNYLARLLNTTVHAIHSDLCCNTQHDCETLFSGVFVEELHSNFHGALRPGASFSETAGAYSFLKRTQEF